jgi:DnaJ like chaperone protein
MMSVTIRVPSPRLEPIDRMPLIFVVALIGLALGGFRGMIISVVVSYALSWATRAMIVKKLASVQEQFLETTFAVMGAVCKSDGVVTRDEIAMAESMFVRLNLSAEQKELAKSAFARGKAKDFDLDAHVQAFAAASRGQRPLHMMLLQIQIAAVMGDGNVHPAEHQMLVRVARLLGLTEADVAQLEALLRTGGGARGPSPQHSLENAYAALGLTSAATDAEIKKTYRRLMSQHHPDKLAGKGLPESMREMAEQKTREISTAYAVIKEARGFT